MEIASWRSNACRCAGCGRTSCPPCDASSPFLSAGGAPTGNAFSWRDATASVVSSSEAARRSSSSSSSLSSAEVKPVQELDACQPRFAFRQVAELGEFLSQLGQRPWTEVADREKLFRVYRQNLTDPVDLPAA